MILDTLMLINDGSPGMVTPQFTVNTALPEVVTTFPAAPNTWYGVFADANGYQRFAPKDNLNIKSVAIVLPYCFGLSGPAWFTISWRENLTDYQVPEWGSTGREWIYTNQVEIPIDLYLPWNPNGPGVNNADICMSAGVFPISMIGVPALFNTAVLPVQVWLKIEHTLPLLP